MTTFENLIGFFSFGSVRCVCVCVRAIWLDWDVKCVFALLMSEPICLCVWVWIVVCLDAFHQFRKPISYLQFYQIKSCSVWGFFRRLPYACSLSLSRIYLAFNFFRSFFIIIILLNRMRNNVFCQFWFSSADESDKIDRRAHHTMSHTNTHIL